MPITSTTQARDAIYGCLQTAMAASAYASVPIFYPDAVKDHPNGQETFLRAFVDLTTERQRSLGETGNRRFRVYGIVTVQVFTPYGDGQVTADLISGIVKGAFRGVNTGSDAITFRNTRVVDVGRDGTYLQTNVLSEFDYDEIA
jgi:hypothetical protein